MQHASQTQGPAAEGKLDWSSNVASIGLKENPQRPRERIEDTEEGALLSPALLRERFSFR